VTPSPLAPGARGRPEEAALREALGATGAIGATYRQLASVVDLPPPRVQEALERWERDGSVQRLGRGLWVLRAYATLLERDDFVDPKSFDERFLRENGVAIGQYRGPITFRSNETLPVHRWWPYVQGYSAEFVRGVLSGAEIGPGGTVLDPFAGSGTTLVEARRAGALALGAELLAPAVLAARVKTAFELDGGLLFRRAEGSARAARVRSAGPLPFLRETRRQFAPRALDELLRLRDALPAGGTAVEDAVRLAFGRILIPSSRLHRSPCLGYRRRDAEGGASPTDRFLAAAREMATTFMGSRRSGTRGGRRPASTSPTRAGSGSPRARSTSRSPVRRTSTGWTTS